MHTGIEMSACGHVLEAEGLTLLKIRAVAMDYVDWILNVAPTQGNLRPFSCFLEEKTVLRKGSHAVCKEASCISCLDCCVCFYCVV